MAQKVWALRTVSMIACQTHHIRRRHLKRFGGIVILAGRENVKMRCLEVEGAITHLEEEFGWTIRQALFDAVEPD